MTLLLALVIALQVPAGTPPPVQDVDVDPALRAVVERFFATQQAEDVEGYLALWSPKAKRPTAAQLKYIFDAGEDEFQDLRIIRASVSGDTARVRVSTIRVRTDIRVKKPDGTPRLLRTPLQFALAFVREEGDWKLVREGLPADELAVALIEAADPAERQALLDAEPDLVNVRLFEAVSRQADAFVRQTQHRAAQEVYERSLEIALVIRDRKSEGQALQNIANALYYQRNFAESRALSERRLTLEREEQNEDGIASALIGIATIQYSTYEYTDALATYREALEIQERLDDQLLIANTLISTGSILYLRGEYEAAVADYRRAEALKRKYRDLGGAATALEGLGRVHVAQGDYASALGVFAGALAERRKMNDLPRQGAVLHSIGDVHFRLGNLDEARAAFAEARTSFEQVKELAAAGRALQGTAITELVAGRAPLGEQAYLDSITACTSANDRGCVAVSQAGLGFALSAQRKFQQAVDWYGKAVTGFIELDYAEQAARARVGLAEALTGKGEYDRAYDEAVSARTIAIELHNDDLLWRALVSQAHADRKRRRKDEALGAAKAAVAAVRSMIAASLERPTVKVSRDTTAAFAAVAVLQAEAGEASGALETSESMRAHSLRLWLAPHEREISRGMTDEERAEERTLTVDLTTLLVRQERESKLQKPDAESLARLEREIAAAVTARHAARERLFARLPELKRARGLESPPSLQEVEALLDAPSRRLLSFVVDEHDLVVLLASRPAPDEPVHVAAYLVPLERQTLGERIAQATEPAVLNDVAAWRTRAAELFAFLPDEVVGSLRMAQHVTVIPHDLLWRVPFEAMPDGDAFLADRAFITYASSVHTALPSVSSTGSEALVPAESTGSAPPTDTTPLLIVAGPDLPAATIERLKATAPSWTLRTPESALLEAETIASLYEDPPAQSISGAEATPSAVKSATPFAAAIHVAAPFRINSAGPLFSSVLLAEDDTGDREATAADSRLEMREVFSLDVGARTLVLSDPAALSMREAAAAFVPVDWAWRTAGTSAVVVRRWSVEGKGEHASAALLRDFHERLRDGAPPADALRSAAATLRREPATRAPGAWAGWLVLSAR